MTGPGRLAGKVAIVTGAAREGRAVADEIGEAATFVRLDIRREDDWAAAVAAAEALGPLTCS